jgi:hypothetical protein
MLILFRGNRLSPREPSRPLGHRGGQRHRLRQLRHDAQAFDPEAFTFDAHFRIAGFDILR